MAINLGLILSLVLFSPLILATEISDQTLRYSVRYTQHDAGELEIIISNESNAVKITVISHLSSIAKLFLSGLTAETWFTKTDSGYALSHGQVLSHDSQAVKRSFKIDRLAATLQFDSEPSIPLDKGVIYEFTSFPLALITSDIAKSVGKRVNEINVKRSRAYVYTKPESMNVELSGKTYQTWKVLRHKVDDISRTVTVWLDKNNQNIPIKIVTSKKSKEVVFNLISN